MTKLLTHKPTYVIQKPKPSGFAGADTQTHPAPQELLDMLSYSRIDRGMAESRFINRFLISRGFESDAFGNLWAQVGNKPRVLWSAHSDSVSDHDGRQTVVQSGNILSLAKGSPSTCLGADNAAGVYCLTSLFDQGVEGLYVICRGEESGGLGSRWIVKNIPEMLSGIDYAIAFDRRNFRDVITHQGGKRTASDKFAESLASRLGAGYEPTDRGVFTDTAIFAELVGEATNLSVGFQDEHSPWETLHVGHISRLIHAMLGINVSDLPVDRQPGEDDYYYQVTPDMSGGGWSGLLDHMTESSDYPKYYDEHESYEACAEAIWRNPYHVLDYLIHLGHTPAQVMRVLDQWGAELERLN